MTEDEAKTKFCCGPPFVAAATLVAYPAFGLSDMAIFGKCIGSACMAWRWRVVPEDGVEFHHKVIDHPTLKGHKTSVDVPGRAPVIGDGHCGLAGKQ